MAAVTRDLIRRRAEHNEGEIFTLEELSLHQMKISKIEHIDQWCPNLKILYLQGNEITKLENLRRLKRMQYLNLALNQIEMIENLEGCESLSKLDLTVNCIWKLTGLTHIKDNYALRELYLMGNPCTRYHNYRPYVVGLLQQLESLDGVAVSYIERLSAKLNFASIEKDIQEQEENHPAETTATERAPEIRERLTDETGYVASTISKIPSPDNSPITSTDGRILNSNKANIIFTLDEEEDRIVLTVKIAKHVDTSVVEVDVEPTYVRVVIKGRLLQLVLPAEVQTDQSVAQRSIASGDLVITMPTVARVLQPKNLSNLQQDDIPDLEPISSVH